MNLRGLTLTLLSLNSIALSQYDITIIRGSFPTANSMGLNWRSVPVTTPPATYTLYSSSTFDGEYLPLATTMDTMWVDSSLAECTRFYCVAATDVEGTTYGSSDTCGYKNFVVVGSLAGRVWTPFGILFRTWDLQFNGIPRYGVDATDPSDIVGNQVQCGTIADADRIVRQDNGEFAYRGNGCAWTQLLQSNHNMIPGRAYWYMNRSGVNRQLVIAGKADISTTYSTVAMTPPPVNGGLVSTAYSWREPRYRPMTELQLIASGFTGGTVASSDRILSQCVGQYAWYRTNDGAWQGSLPTPTDPCGCSCYWIQSRHIATWAYTYDPTSNLP